MAPHLYRIIVAFAVAGFIALMLAILFFGYSSTSGGLSLDYPRLPVPSEKQYKDDEQFIYDFLIENGFRERHERNIVDKTSRANKPPDGYIYVTSYEHPIHFSRPVSIELYRNESRSGFWIFIHARNPTWAVPKMKSVLESLRSPLWRAWRNHTKTENG